MHCSVASSQQKEASNTASHLYVGKLLEHNTITGANLCTTQPRPCSCFPDQATVRPVTSSHSLSCSTAQDPSENEALELTSCTLSTLQDENFPPAHHVNTESPAFLNGWFSSPRLGVAKKECHPIQPVQKGEVGGRTIISLVKFLECSTTSTVARPTSFK